MLYAELTEAAAALVAGEPDPIANMANVAALIWETLPDLNWAGFYRNVDGELVLGPFQGRPACIRIPFGQGDRADGRTSSIAGFQAPSRPLDLDLDSPAPGRFTEEDEAGCVALCGLLAKLL